MRFGLDLSTSAAPDTDPVRDALTAEELGFDFVSASDHPCGVSPTHETWTLLTWIAAATSRIGIATRVLGVPYRSPAMVAKMAATLDHFSGGRLTLGLGGGASDEEFQAFGLEVPSPRAKVEGLEDAVRITKGLWSQPKFTYRGSRYHTDGADLEPKPDRHIPIWLGTYGPRALELTGRLADGWIPSHGYASSQEFPAMRDRVLNAATDADRSPDELTLAYNVEVEVGSRTVPSATTVSGPVDSVVERLREFVDLGFTTINLKPVGPDRPTQTELLAHEVIPAVLA